MLRIHKHTCSITPPPTIHVSLKNIVAFPGKSASPLAVVPRSLTRTRHPFSTLTSTATLHMRSEAPKEPKPGRKLESVKVSAALEEVEVLEGAVLGAPRVRVRPSEGQAEPE